MKNFIFDVVSASTVTTSTEVVSEGVSILPVGIIILVSIVVPVVALLFAVVRIKNSREESASAQTDSSDDKKEEEEVVVKTKRDWSFIWTGLAILFWVSVASVILWFAVQWIVSLSDDPVVIQPVAVAAPPISGIDRYYFFCFEGGGYSRTCSDREGNKFMVTVEHYVPGEVLNFVVSGNTYTRYTSDTNSSTRGLYKQGSTEGVWTLSFEDGGAVGTAVETKGDVGERYEIFLLPL
ncbi:MAG: hypothetical protein KAR24_00420 [Candidatus Pacebacteria bacterium]|nr:hypothetical protein [Candidatus Paceibacterota bacterium]